MENDWVSNAYSDHTHMRLSGAVSTSNLNAGEPGNFKMFPNEILPFVWSATYRHGMILENISTKKEDLTRLGQQFLNIVQDQDPTLSIAQKNAMIAHKANEIIPTLNSLGFPVKSFVMLPSKLFQPTVPPAELWKNPESDTYLKEPSYFLENPDSYLQRSKLGYQISFEGNPDIVTLQEVALGNSDGLDLTGTFLETMKNYSDYEYKMPPMSGVKKIATPLTFYNKEVLCDVSNVCMPKITELREKMKAFQPDDAKIVIHALYHLMFRETIYVINIHGDYNYANNYNPRMKWTTENGPWDMLKELLNTTPNLIVAGDFNLQKQNKKYYDHVVDGFKGKHMLTQTPESVNPTYDMIFNTFG